MFATPAEAPVTMPVEGPTDAIVVLLLDQIIGDGSGVASVSVVLRPMHTANVPAIAAGVWLTVTSFVTWQPVDKV